MVVVASRYIRGEYRQPGRERSSHQGCLSFSNHHKLDGSRRRPAQFVVPAMNGLPAGTPAAHATRVALLGFGTVGQAVARILTRQPPPGVALTHVFNRNIARKRAGLGRRRRHLDRTRRGRARSRADIVVELIGGLDPAGAWVRRALAAGKSVVTANKQLIAHRGAALLALARSKGVELALRGDRSPAASRSSRRCAKA